MANAEIPGIETLTQKELVDGLSNLLVAITEEAKVPEHQVVISFWKDEEWLGAVVVKAKGGVSAMMKILDLGLYPGGNVEYESVPKTHEVGESDLNRLLTREDIQRFADTLDK
jgi:hypothetical protein